MRWTTATHCKPLSASWPAFISPGSGPGARPWRKRPGICAWWIKPGGPSPRRARCCAICFAGSGSCRRWPPWRRFRCRRARRPSSSRDGWRSGRCRAVFILSGRSGMTRWQAPGWCMSTGPQNSALPNPSPPPAAPAKRQDDAANDAPNNPQKARTGLRRIWHAAGYSIDGLRAGWNERAFRQEAIAAIVMLPLSLWLGRNWGEVALLAGAVVLVLIVELLNTGIESAIDRIGAEAPGLAKSAQDLGSAAVLLALLLCMGIWAAAAWQRFFHG